MTKCDHCPVVGPCIAERPGHAFACAMAARGSEAELRWIVDQSAGVVPAPVVEYPPLLAQAGAAIMAAGRFVASGLATADQAERDHRMGICRACPNFDADAARCRLCGCFAALKARIEASKCPDDPPKW